mmetsp:Transcript_17522/g.27414  ORF Transcript_17522/g.27414 Transcript_17522/m.27414 type:complete len:178 (-) Transcript_17522:331-864(-)
MFSLKFLSKKTCQNIVNIFSSQMSISTCCFDFENTLVQRQDSTIQSTASKIKNKNLLFLVHFLFQTISHSSSSRFIHNSQNLQTSDFTSIFCCQTLSVIKISRNSDNSFFDFTPKVILRNNFHFLKNHGGDFFWVEIFGFSFESDLNSRPILSLLHNCKWPLLQIFLDHFLREMTTN